MLITLSFASKPSCCFLAPSPIDRNAGTAAANTVVALNTSLAHLNTTLNNLDQAVVSHSSQFTTNVGEASASFVEVRDSIQDMSKEIQSTIDGLNTYVENLMRD